jgi:hypothetical protein
MSESDDDKPLGTWCEDARRPGLPPDAFPRGLKRVPVGLGFSGLEAGLELCWSGGARQMARETGLEGAGPCCCELFFRTARGARAWPTRGLAARAVAKAWQTACSQTPPLRLVLRNTERTARALVDKSGAICALTLLTVLLPAFCRCVCSCPGARKAEVKAEVRAEIRACKALCVAPVLPRAFCRSSCHSTRATAEAPTLFALSLPAHADTAHADTCSNVLWRIKPGA